MNEHSSSSTSGSRGRVLVVDDNHSVRHLLRLELETAGTAEGDGRIIRLQPTG